MALNISSSILFRSENVHSTYHLIGYPFSSSHLSITISWMRMISFARIIDDVWAVVMTTAPASNQKLKNVYSVIAS